MTVGQAVVKFLNKQYVEMDGMFATFGHGIVAGLGQVLDEAPGRLRVYQGRNEQGMAHAAMSYAKQCNRRRIIACASFVFRFCSFSLSQYGHFTFTVAIAHTCLIFL